jgi:hypothetical protein
MTKDESLVPQPLDDDEVESLWRIAERMRYLWLLGELPSLDELKEWAAVLGGVHAWMKR